MFNFSADVAIVESLNLSACERERRWSLTLNVMGSLGVPRFGSKIRVWEFSHFFLILSF